MKDGAGEDLVVRRSQGLYCPAGDFFIDPWRPVERAVLAHAHADHARSGHGSYLAHWSNEPILRTRLGSIAFQGLEFGARLRIGDALLSLHPAGHVLGSAQVRIEVGGRIWVASGDYRFAAQDAVNPTCQPFEPVRCHCFITESTFGLPIYRWPPPARVFAEIDAWWHETAAQSRVAILYGYSLGKTQRLLTGIDSSIGPIYVHSAVDRINRAYQAAGVALPATRLLDASVQREALRGALAIVPPAFDGSEAKRLGESSTGFASGWMRLRGARRRRAVDRGFVLSDHADWPGLNEAIRQSGAQRVIVTHGYEDVMVRWLTERGIQAGSFVTEFGDERLVHCDGGASSEAANASISGSSASASGQQR